MSTVKMGLTIVLSFLTQTAILACEVCVKQQPKMLRGITHGTGPQSSWDYVTVLFMAILVATSFFFCVKWILRPGENDKEHIKNSILSPD
jgi:hypothetical protein